jgi:hypothetical protein
MFVGYVTYSFALVIRLLIIGRLFFGIQIPLSSK